MTLQVRNDDIADRDDGRIAAGERLDRHLPAAQKDQLHVQPILAENSFVLRHPELPLPRADRRITDADLMERLSSRRRPRHDTDSVKATNNAVESHDDFHVLMTTVILRQASTCPMLTGLFTMCLLAGEVYNEIQIRTLLGLYRSCIAAASPVSAQLKKVRFSVSAASIAEVPFRIAHIKGFYRDEGLDVEMIFIRGAVGMQALLGGSVDYTSASGSTIAAAVRGIPVKLVFIASAKPQFDLVAQPQIRSVARSEGQTRRYLLPRRRHRSAHATDGAEKWSSAQQRRDQSRRRRSRRHRAGFTSRSHRRRAAHPAEAADLAARRFSPHRLLGRLHADLPERRHRRHR